MAETREFKKIIEADIDIAKKYRVLVDINGDSLLLKFQSAPTEQEVINEVNKYISNNTDLNIVQEMIDTTDSNIKRLNEDKVKLNEEKEKLEIK